MPVLDRAQRLDQGLTTQPWHCGHFGLGGALGGCPSLCRLFSSVSGLYLIDARGTPLVVAIKSVSRHRHIPPGGNTTPG